MSGIMAFPVPASAEGEGALSRGGVLEREGALVRQGHRDERLQSQLRRGDHALRMLSFFLAVLLLLCFSFSSIG